MISRSKGNCQNPSGRSMAAYVGCIAGGIKIDDYRAGLLAAGFEHMETVDSGADLNTYVKAENQSGCCSPAMAGSHAVHPHRLMNRPRCTRSCQSF